MKIRASFCDLSHDGHFCNGIPYGVVLVAQYTLKDHADKLEAEYFKKPQEFLDYLERGFPKIACFSNYIWSAELSLEIARRIKERSPETIVVMGGPNFPSDPREHEEFLQAHPWVDFHIYKEGEQAFKLLFETLLEAGLDASRLKESGKELPSCHYIRGGKMVCGPLMPRLKNLDDVPSPYLTGAADKLLRQPLIPMIQTTRGCPFQCTFCQEGNSYFTKLSRFSLERIRDEVEYIARHTDAPHLLVIDSNFGMYEEDILVCKEIAKIQKKHGWPKSVAGFAGKNMKDRVLEGVRIVGGEHFLSAAIQSTSQEVLKNVKRSNIQVDKLIGFASEGEAMGANTFSELILGLPGDTKEDHLRGISELIDAGISVVRSHQFIMLPDSESTSRKDRERFGMVTRFRVTPKTFASYRLLGETFEAPEIDEICVANKTLSFEDYKDCRVFNLTVEVFYNNGIFLELHKFLRLHGIRVSEFIRRVHERATDPAGPLAAVYRGFLEETCDLWESREELQAFIRRPEVMEKLKSGQMGRNEQIEYRGAAVFNHLREMHDISYGVAKEMLEEQGRLGPQGYGYLEELREYSLASKSDLFSVSKSFRLKLHYDFPRLAAANFNADPFSHYVSGGLDVGFAHVEDQRRQINKLLEVYGTSPYSMGYILSSGSHMRALYRKPRVLTEA